MLWMRESQISFEPVNQAVLIQTFVRGLLGKLGGAGKRSDLDERNIEHFLGHLAEHFIKEWKHSVPRLTIEKIAIDYFHSFFDLKYLHLSAGDVLNELIRRGVLIEINGGIGFKYRCFFEYFAAQRMGDSREFYEEVTLTDNILRFSREIDTFTALKRDDEAILKKLTEQTETCFEQINSKFDLERFNALPSPLITKLSTNEIKRDLEEAKPDRETKDDILDSSTRSPNFEIDQCPSATDKDHEHYEPGELLELLSRVLRNSELVKIGEDDKYILASNIFRYWGMLLAEIMTKAEEAKDTEELPPEIRKLGPQLPLIIIPQLLLQICNESIGSAKLGGMLKNVYSEEKNPALIRLLSALVYFELRLEKRFELIRGLMILVKDKPFLASIAFVKLRIVYMMGELSKHEEEVTLDMLTELYVCMQNISGGMASKELALAKSQIQLGLKTQKDSVRALGEGN